MSEHTPKTPKDGRKRVQKKKHSKGGSAEYGGNNLTTKLGLLVRAVLWWEWLEYCGNNGQEQVRITRKFVEAHCTKQQCARWVDKHFPGFTQAANAIIRASENYTGSSSQDIRFRLYRNIWSGYHDRTKEDPKERHGHFGPRHPKVHKELGNAVIEIEKIALKYGPDFVFEYDPHDLDLAPKVKKEK